MFRVCVCLAVLVAVQAATTMMMTTTHKPHHGHHTHGTGTHGTGPTHEPSEKDNLRFVYEAHTHQMLMINMKNCYLFTLSDSERTAVHTDVGIRTLELKLLNMLTTATKTEVILTDQPKFVQKACGHAVNHTYTVMQ